MPETNCGFIEENIALRAHIAQIEDNLKHSNKPHDADKLELRHLRTKRIESKNHIAALDNSLVERGKKLREVHERLREVETEVRKQHAESIEDKKEIENAYSSDEWLINLAKARKKRAGAYEKEIEDLKERLDQEVAALRTEQGRVKGANAARERLQEERDEAVSEIATLEETLSTRFKTSETTVEAAFMERERLGRERDEATARANKCVVIVDKMTEEQFHTKTELKNLRAQCVEDKKRITKLERQTENQCLFLETAKSIENEIRNRLHDVENERDEAMSARHDLRESLRERIKRHDAAISKIDVLSARLKNSEAENESEVTRLKVERDEAREEIVFLKKIKEGQAGMVGILGEKKDKAWQCQNQALRERNEARKRVEELLEERDEALLEIERLKTMRVKFMDGAVGSVNITEIKLDPQGE